MGLKELQELKGKAKEPKPKTYGTLRKKSEKKIKKESEDEAIFRKDDEMYNKIWRTRPHVCFECGKPLGYKIRRWYFHHLLEKHRFQQFRHNEDNIVLLCQIHHDQVMLDIDKVPVTKKHTEFTKKVLLHE